MTSFWPKKESFELIWPNWAKKGQANLTNLIPVMTYLIKVINKNPN